jgi:hypothetical protein
MAANDTTNALKHPHPEVPFAHVGDDTITALTQLAEIFKNKFSKLKSPELSHSPIKAAENKRPSALTHPILTSPMQHKYQTGSQTTINGGSKRHTITSEGDHTNDGSGSISEGAIALTKSFPQKFVTT